MVHTFKSVCFISFFMSIGYCSVRGDKILYVLILHYFSLIGLDLSIHFSIKHQERGEVGGSVGNYIFKC